MEKSLNKMMKKHIRFLKRSNESRSLYVPKSINHLLYRIKLNKIRYLMKNSRNYKKG